MNFIFDVRILNVATPSLKTYISSCEIKPKTIQGIKIYISLWLILFVVDEEKHQADATDRVTLIPPSSLQSLRPSLYCQSLLLAPLTALGSAGQKLGALPLCITAYFSWGSSLTLQQTASGATRKKDITKTK